MRRTIVSTLDTVVTYGTRTGYVGSWGGGSAAFDELRHDSQDPLTDPYLPDPCPAIRAENFMLQCSANGESESGPLNFKASTYHAGSGLYRLFTFTGHPKTLDIAYQTVLAAVLNYESQLQAGYLAQPAAEKLLEGVATACMMQAHAFDTNAFEECHGAVIRLAKEMKPSDPVAARNNLLDKLLGFTGVRPEFNVSLDASLRFLTFSTSFTSIDNSLSTHLQLLMREKQCADWRAKMERNNCPIV